MAGPRDSVATPMLHGTVKTLCEVLTVADAMLLLMAGS